MASVTFAIPDEVKLEMKRFAWVNWSELAKEEVLKQDKKSKLFKKLDKLPYRKTGLLDNRF